MHKLYKGGEARIPNSPEEAEQLRRQGWQNQPPVDAPNSPDADVLPDDFPHRAELLQAGLNTVSAVRSVILHLDEKQLKEVKKAVESHDSEKDDENDGENKQAQKDIRTLPSGRQNDPDEPARRATERVRARSNSGANTVTTTNDVADEDVDAARLRSGENAVMGTDDVVESVTSDNKPKTVRK